VQARSRERREAAAGGVPTTFENKKRVAAISRNSLREVSHYTRAPLDLDSVQFPSRKGGRGDYRGTSDRVLINGQMKRYFKSRCRL